ncbi:MAG: phosphoribosyltransferase family protein [Acidilobaceae archaeon]
MVALLSVLAFDDLWDVSPMIRYGLLSLRHRGNERYLTCVTDGSKLSCRWSKSIEGVVERGRSVAIVAAFPSDSVDSAHAVGAYGEVEVAVIASREYRELPVLAYSIASALSAEATNTLSKLERVLNEFKDLPSFLAISNRGEIIAHRDALGLTPLVLGGYGFDLAIVASESSAIEILDGEVRRHLEPGEFVFLSRRFVKTKRRDVSPCGLCLFELLYMARHDSVVDGVSVYEFRRTLGARLTKGMKNSSEVDVVVGVPESAIPYAIGLAEALRKPYDLAFVPTVRMRSMLKSNPLYKLIAIHLKMNPIRSALEGKRVAIVDDSMVTGATAKTVSQLLRLRIGAKEVHFFVASPPIVNECPYSLLKFNRESLVAANLSSSDIESYLEVDSLTWLSLDDVKKEAESRDLRICSACFTSEAGRR